MKRELHKASIRWILQIKNKMPIFLFYRNVKLLIVTTSNTILEHLQLQNLGTTPMVCFDPNIKLLVLCASATNHGDSRSFHSF